MINISYSQPTGNCLVLNGNSDYYEVTDNSTLEPTTTVSFEAWINPCDLSGNVLTKLWCSGSRTAYYFSIVNGYLRWLWDSDDSCNNQSTSYESDLPSY